MLWIFDLLNKSINDKIINKDMISYKKCSIKTLLFDSIPIESYIFNYFMLKLVLETNLSMHI